MSSLKLGAPGDKGRLRHDKTFHFLHSCQTILLRKRLKELLEGLVAALTARRVLAFLVVLSEAALVGAAG